MDEPALVEALGPGGRLGGAALDVFDQEPLPADHPFWGMTDKVRGSGGGHGGLPGLILGQGRHRPTPSFGP